MCGHQAAIKEIMRGEVPSGNGIQAMGKQMGGPICREEGLIRTK